MDTDWMYRLSHFIKVQRKKLGLSQADLAEKTGMNTSYISRLESGESFQSVKIDFLLKLADAFDMDENEIIRLVGLRK
jgi:transcriptional regulator with XRE-family HTH domain